LVLMLLVRFAVPVVSVGSEGIYDRFLSGEYQQSATGLSSAADSVDSTITELRQEEKAAAQRKAGSTSQTEAKPEDNPGSATPQPSDDPSWWPWGKDKANDILGDLGKTFSKFDPRPYLERLKQQAGEAIDHMINLIVVFVLQTVLVPMFLLWAMYLALRSCIGKQNPS